MFGFALALLDAVKLSVIKEGQDGVFWVGVASLIAMVQVWIFWLAMRGGENLVNLNLIWDLGSVILIILVSLLWFSESISWSQGVGLLLGGVALFLLR